MPKPTITEKFADTGETVEREMTDDEYAALIASGWTLEPQRDFPATWEPGAVADFPNPPSEDEK